MKKYLLAVALLFGGVYLVSESVSQVEAMWAAPIKFPEISKDDKVDLLRICAKIT
ncbi:hypothetical protein FACS189449_10970 [Alphaproteobacteria bacterium]|nr:hypothetical protein FACS189449_10970 [Alphaproteobacteria bacterium]